MILISKAMVYSSIPTKVFKQNFDICSDIITNMYNNSTIAATFPSNMKCADVSPVHKRMTIPIKKITDLSANCPLCLKYLNAF